MEPTLELQGSNLKVVSKLANNSSDLMISWDLDTLKMGIPQMPTDILSTSEFGGFVTLAHYVATTLVSKQGSKAVNPSLFVSSRKAHDPAQ